MPNRKTHQPPSQPSNTLQQDDSRRTAFRPSGTAARVLSESYAVIVQHTPGYHVAAQNVDRGSTSHGSRHVPEFSRGGSYSLEEHSRRQVKYHRKQKEPVVRPVDSNIKEKQAFRKEGPPIRREVEANRRDGEAAIRPVEATRRQEEATFGQRKAALKQEVPATGEAEITSAQKPTIRKKRAGQQDGAVSARNEISQRKQESIERSMPIKAFMSAKQITPNLESAPRPVQVSQQLPILQKQEKVRSQLNPRRVLLPQVQPTKQVQPILARESTPVNVAVSTVTRRARTGSLPRLDTSLAKEFVHRTGTSPPKGASPSTASRAPNNERDPPTMYLLMPAPSTFATLGKTHQGDTSDVHDEAERDGSVAKTCNTDGASGSEALKSVDTPSDLKSETSAMEIEEWHSDISDETLQYMEEWELVSCPSE